APRAGAHPPKTGDPQQQPPTSTGSGAEQANKPGIGNPPAAQSLAPSRIDAKVLEEAKQRDPEEERLLACRAVRAMPGQPAPSGQYGRSEERRVGEEGRSLCDWSSDVCSSDLVLEEAKQRDPEEERLLACRAVRAMPGQPAPSGQYG